MRNDLDLLISPGCHLLLQVWNVSQLVGIGDEIDRTDVLAANINCKDVKSSPRKIGDDTRCSIHSQPPGFHRLRWMKFRSAHRDSTRNIRGSVDGIRNRESLASPVRVKHRILLQHLDQRL